MLVGIEKAARQEGSKGGVLVGIEKAAREGDKLQAVTIQQVQMSKTLCMVQMLFVFICDSCSFSSI